MQVELRSPARKFAAYTTVVTVAFLYLSVTAKQVLADYCAQFHDEPHLTRAIALDPGNAEYRQQLGDYELAKQSPSLAENWFTSATVLNPHVAHHWTHLALAQQLMGETSAEINSLERAIKADPRDSGTAWETANLYWAQGSPERAATLLRAVLENDTYRAGEALNAGWRMHPDTDYLLGNVVPPGAYDRFLEFLIAKNDVAAAAKVWDRIFAAHQSVERRYLFEYIHSLIGVGDVAQASRVWQEASELSDIEAYQPSSQNLLINGEFSLPILNGGFDWIHNPVAGVELALDTSQSHSGSRSLRITFDGPGIADAGIFQLVPVEPNTSYEFSASYQAEDMDGAGGMEFSISDVYKGTPLFRSGDLRNADFWKASGGTFVTGAETRLVVLQLARIPSGSPIRGKLWIDGLRLVQTSGDSAQ